MNYVKDFNEFINEGYFRVPDEDLEIKDLESFGNVSWAKEEVILEIPKSKIDPKALILSKSSYEDWDPKGIKYLFNVLTKYKKVKDVQKVEVKVQGTRNEVAGYYFVPLVTDKNTEKYYR